MYNFQSREWTCALCGSSFDSAAYKGEHEWWQIMEEQHCCFECAYWLRLSKVPVDGRQVIDGNLYSFLTRPIRYDSSTKYFYTNAGQACASYKYTFLGKIPKRFIHLFDNTAVFISKQSYNIITNNIGVKCLRKGCWDRTHCFWYQDSEMNWNTIPETHQPGDEHCPNFLNKFKL